MLKKFGSFIAEAGNKETEGHLWQAGEHKKEAQKHPHGSKKFHAAMAAHWESMGEYHASRGNHNLADHADDRAEYHNDKAHDVKEEALDEAEMSHKQHADAIRKAADKYRDLGHRRWHDDKEMCDMHDADHKDLHKVAAHVEKGDYKAAHKHMQKMDTAAREEVPARQYSHILKHAGMKKHIYEASAQARQNKMAKNIMDTLRGHRYNQSQTKQTRLTPDQTGHKTPQQMNKALGRALRNEEIDDLTESGDIDHAARAKKFMSMAERHKPGTEPYFHAMANYHHHAGKHAKAQGDEEGAREHFISSYSYSRKD